MKVGPSVKVACSTFEASQKKLGTFIHNHPFTHQLEVLRPRWEESSPVLPGIPLPEEDSFQFVTCRLHAFLSLQFLHSVVDNLGVEFRAISVDSSLDPGDAVAITASGQLHLRLSRESYQKIGLLGRKSNADPGQYQVHVDLTSNNFRKREQHYQRVLDCLESCESPVDFVCSMGCEALLEGSDVVYSKVIPNEVTSRSFATQLPQLQKLRRSGSLSPMEKLEPAEMDYALEWIGKLSLGSPDALVEGDQNCRAGVLEAQRWTGLVLPHHVEACVQNLRGAVADGSMPWGAINASGFAHSAISWEGEGRRANPFTDGSKDYVVLILPDDQYITFLLSGGNQC